MGSFGGYYKGEKKKPKKGQENKNSGSSPYIIQLPEIISKKKKENR